MGTLTQTQEGLKFTGTLTNIQAGDTTVLTIKANGDLVPTGIITGYATETYVGTAISNLIDSSPAALNTLNELAAALGDDASFSTTVTTSIATKLPLAGGTLTGPLQAQSWLFRTMATGTEYHVLDNGSLNGPSWKMRYDGATANRYVDFGYKDGNGNYTSGLKLYNNSTVSWRGTDIINASGQWIGAIPNLSGTNTGDQTAAQILTAIKTVDGTGSGLDADTLDGIDSSAFLRSNAADSFDGTLSWGNSFGTDAFDLNGGDIEDANGVRAREFTQIASGTPRNNLGSPTVTEMALFEPQFTCKTDLSNSYDDLADLTFHKQMTSGGAWEEVTVSDDQKRRFLRTNNSGVVIPNTAYKFRVEYVAKGYTFGNALYVYWSSNSHNSQVHIWKRRCSDNVWIQHTSSTTTVSSWPGHLWLPFSTIPWLEDNTTSTGHFNTIRIEFTPSWSTGTYSNRDINLSGGQIWGGYPSGRRTPHYYDQNGKLFTYGDLEANGKLYIDTRDANTSSTAALVMNGNEVEQRTLGSNAFNSTSYSTATGVEDNADVTDATNVAAAGALMTAGGTLTGATTIQTTGGAMLKLQDTNSLGDAATPYINFLDSAGTRQGYVGIGSGGNAKLYLEGLDGIQTNNPLSVSGSLTVSTTGNFAGKVNFQGDAAIEGGTGYGVFKGYASNDNHFIAVRGIVANQDELSITGGHQTTFVEHADAVDEGWYFKSFTTGTYREIARIDGLNDMYLGGDKVWHAGNLTPLTIGATSSTAMAGNTSLFDGAYGSLSGLPALGSAALTSANAYATSTQGTTADNALPKSGGTMTGTLQADVIKDSLYLNAGNSGWKTKKWVRNVGVSGGSINQKWVKVLDVPLTASAYTKTAVKMKIHGYDDVSSGTENIDVRYENASTAQEYHEAYWYTTDNTPNIFSEVRSIRYESDGLTNSYQVWVKMAGDWRDTFTVEAEYWISGTDTISFPTEAGTATAPSGDSNDIALTTRSWKLNNSSVYIGSAQVATQSYVTGLGYQTSQRAISSTPTDGATTTAISSDWAFDNVKTAVPASAVFTDTVNTFDGAYGSLSGAPSLGSAALTASSSYATSAQGTTADAALPKAGGTLTGGLTGTSAIFAGLVTTKTYKTTSAYISNSYVRIAEIDDIGGMISSTVRVTMTAHGNSHVTTCNAIISVGHSQDILIQSDNLDYTNVTLKVESNNNGKWTLSVKSSSANSTNYQFDIQALGNNLSITPTPTTSQTGTTLEHTTNFGTNITGVTANTPSSGGLKHQFGGKMFFNNVDSNTDSTTALVLDGNEVEKRTLGSNAFNSTAIPSGNSVIDWTVDNSNTVIHSGNYTDTDTWVANSATAAGYVASGAGMANKVWKTDANGLPGWDDDRDTVYTHPTGDGDNHIPTGGSAGEFLKYSASGTATWATPSYIADTTYTGGTGMTLNGTVFNCDITSPADVALDNLSSSGNALAGAFTATGDITAFSDARVKENVETIPNALEKVTALRGVNFNKIGEEKRSTGVIAQEVKEVLPEVIHENEDGMLSVAYGNITGVLIEAIKEQQKQIEELKAMVVNLKNSK